MHAACCVSRELCATWLCGCRTSYRALLCAFSSAPGLGSPLPHLHSEWAHPCHICTRIGLQDPAIRRFLCTALRPAGDGTYAIADAAITQPASRMVEWLVDAQFAQPDQEVGSPLPHLHRVRARSRHICTGTGITPATSAPGLGSPLPHLHRDWEHSCRICTRALGLAALPAGDRPAARRDGARRRNRRAVDHCSAGGCECATEHGRHRRRRGRGWRGCGPSEGAAREPGADDRRAACLQRTTERGYPQAATCDRQQTSCSTHGHL